ncbi:MAG: prepilin peptidase [Gammaproteobacteria bacterium]|nr:MAG: prepilin peptidase [Gammaproteobacteria bacterium]PIE38257.1 MAG: prepilin peptidase [Gammaproteobacteria bacterium]
MIDTFNQYPLLVGAVVLALGLIVGSFLNVVAYRLPLILERQWRRDCCELLEVGDEQSEQKDTFNLAFPNSHCPNCEAAIKPWQNIPVVSYLLLKGRCANCQTRISPRYPIVELVTGLLSLGLYCHFGLGSTLFGALLLLWVLVALTLIDFDTQLLPDNLTLPLLWLGLVFNLFAVFTPIKDAVLGAMLGYLVLWSVYWLFLLVTGKHGMGHGDFKLLAALGAWLGWHTVPLIILLSSLVGAVVGSLLLLLDKNRRGQPMPFGPYLAGAGLIALVWGQDILTRFFPGISP